MFKKVLVLFSLILVLVLSSFLFWNKWKGEQDTFYIKVGLGNQTIEQLLKTDFETNTELTVGQLLVFYSRLYGNNVSDYDEVKNFCALKEIYLPSDLVYDKDEWEKVWRTKVLGNTVFEKVNDTTYSISLLSGYLTIYLNEQGYTLINQGLIPPQLYFYSPFSGIMDLEEINLNKNASLGFTLEVLMSIDNDGDRKQILHDIVANRIETITGVEEENWESSEIDLYDYYSLSYYGEFSYLKDKGYIDEITVADLSNPISVSDFLILVDKFIK